MHLCWMTFLQIFHTDCIVCDQYRVLFRVGSLDEPQPLRGPSTRVLECKSHTVTIIMLYILTLGVVITFSRWRSK